MALDMKRTSVSAGQGVVVGLPGLEPGTSSLLEIDGWALCYPAFALVVRFRKAYKDGVNFLTPCPSLEHQTVRASSTAASAMTAVPARNLGWATGRSWPR